MASSCQSQYEQNLWKCEHMGLKLRNPGKCWGEKDWIYTTSNNMISLRAIETGW